MSALAPNTVFPVLELRTTNASINVLQWFGAIITEPSVGMFSLPLTSIFLYPQRTLLMIRGFARVYMRLLSYIFLFIFILRQLLFFL